MKIRTKMVHRKSRIESRGQDLVPSAPNQDILVSDRRHQEGPSVRLVRKSVVFVF